MQSGNLAESKPDALLTVLEESWKLLKMVQVMQWDVQGFVWSHSVECVLLAGVKYKSVSKITVSGQLTKASAKYSPCLKNHSCDPENKWCSSAVQNRDNFCEQKGTALLYNVAWWLKCPSGVHFHLHNSFPASRKLLVLPPCALMGDERLSMPPAECANTYRIKIHWVKEYVFSSKYECRLWYGHLIWIGNLRSSFCSKLNL